MSDKSTEPVQSETSRTPSSQLSTVDPAATAAAEGSPQSRPASYVAHTIEEIPPADGAEILAGLPPAEAASVAEFLDPETAGNVLSEMNNDDAAAVLSEMGPPEASVVLSRMDPDDRVDVLGRIEPARREALIGEMNAKDAANIRNLGQYPPDTAGGIMSTDVTALSQDLTAQQAIEELRRINEQLEQMFYVYVVDKAGVLVGVLSMRDLILVPPDRKIAHFMRRSVVSVPATMDQEEVAQLMRKYRYLAVPVTDPKNRLLGLITVDDVVDVMEEEATEDVQRMFGAGAEERLTSPWRFSFRKRIGWLMVNLVTAFLAASVVGLFEHTIETLAILALYMPVVAGMGGNASAQAMAVAIRGIGRDEVSRSQLGHVFHREIRVGAASGIVIGTVAALIAWLFHYSHGLLLGVLVALALFINHTLACVWGAAIPFLMKRLGFDPAQSATIFTTTLTDMIGFFTLLGLATMWMGWLK